ncbi:membrane protein [Thalassospira tepidiphila MCCC 1A03514]|uniref:Probable membrane transporter protein n=2 Tax=Thalassospira tepidiphila TaxID=393657 RepID=A0A853L3N4_9PROT|nr:membrane protein [Thalassospira tepidiphila MCCC 1A03514]
MMCAVLTDRIGPSCASAPQFESDQMEFGFDLLMILFAVATLAGFVDAIAGGGGLITIPALLWAGVTPAQALATNKLQGSFGSFSASLNFIRKGHVDPRDMVLAIVLTFAGSALGTVLVQMLDPGILMTILPGLLILIALYFLFSPRVGDIDAHQMIGKATFAFTAGFGIGFYDGFFGPGTGSFFSIAFVALLGFNMTKATAHTKVLNFTSNFASLVMFIAGGEVVWIVGGVMAVGALIGAQIGSHMVMKVGARLVRPLLVVTSIAISIKLIIDQYGTTISQSWDQIRHWVS